MDRHGLECLGDRPDPGGDPGGVFERREPTGFRTPVKDIVGAIGVVGVSQNRSRRGTR
jgi:hypothetical protein